MNDVKEEPQEKPKRAADSPILKKVDPGTAKLIIKLREEVNRKKLGRRINDYEIIDLGIRQLGSSHIKELQERTYSEQDRLYLAHEEYQRSHGRISLEAFIGKLLKGEVKMEPNLGKQGVSV